MHVRAEICPNCGIRQAHSYGNTDSDMKNKWLITLLLCWFLGIFGVHRFYTGHIAIGVAQLVTLGGCGIWTLVDLIIIAIGNFKDAQGNIIKNV